MAVGKATPEKVDPPVWYSDGNVGGAMVAGTSDAAPRLAPLRARDEKIQQLRRAVAIAILAGDRSTGGGRGDEPDGTRESRADPSDPRSIASFDESETRLSARACAPTRTRCNEAGKRTWHAGEEDHNRRNGIHRHRRTTVWREIKSSATASQSGKECDFRPLAPTCATLTKTLDRCVPRDFSRAMAGVRRHSLTRRGVTTRAICRLPSTAAMWGRRSRARKRAGFRCSWRSTARPTPQRRVGRRLASRGRRVGDLGPETLDRAPPGGSRGRGRRVVSRLRRALPRAWDARSGGVEPQRRVQALRARRVGRRVRRAGGAPRGDRRVPRGVRG